MAGQIPQVGGGGTGGGTGITRVISPVTALPATGALTCIYDLTDATTPANSGYYLWNAAGGIYDRLTTLDELEAAVQPRVVTTLVGVTGAYVGEQIVRAAGDDDDDLYYWTGSLWRKVGA